MPGDVLRKGKSTEMLSLKEMTKYGSGVGKLLHLMKWSRPDIMNCVRELSCFIMEAIGAHIQAMNRVMKYCIGTPDCG